MVNSILEKDKFWSKVKRYIYILVLLLILLIILILISLFLNFTILSKIKVI